MNYNIQSFDFTEHINILRSKEVCSLYNYMCAEPINFLLKTHKVYIKTFQGIICFNIKDEFIKHYHSLEEIFKVDYVNGINTPSPIYIPDKKISQYNNIKVYLDQYISNQVKYMYRKASDIVELETDIHYYVYVRNGKIHHTTKPSIYNRNGKYKYFINDKMYSEQSFSNHPLVKKERRKEKLLKFL